MKRDVVLNELANEMIYIEEKEYQKIKRELGKDNDYFSIKEITENVKKIITFLSLQFEIKQKNLKMKIKKTLKNSLLLKI